MTLEFSKISGYVGAEIRGVNLATENDDRVFQRIKEIINDHGVILFRDQDLTPEQFIRFGEQFGELFINNSPAITSLPGYPKIEDLRKDVHETTTIGDEWHTDQAHRSNPCQFTILHGIEIPTFGGDTLFVSTAAAYEGLPEGVKPLLETLRGVHSSAFILADAIARTGDPDGRFANVTRASAQAIHPVVRVHPETGRKTLYVSPGYTSHFEGWTREDSLPILQMLYRHALRPEYSCRLSWQPRSLVMWDNRQTWHYAVNDYHGQRRVMRRMVVMASEPIGQTAA